jgi:hypothetical protein
MPTNPHCVTTRNNNTTNVLLLGKHPCVMSYFSICPSIQRYLPVLDCATVFQLFSFQSLKLFLSVYRRCFVRKSLCYIIINNFYDTTSLVYLVRRIGIPQSVKFLTTDWTARVQSLAEAKDISSASVSRPAVNPI